MINNNPRERRLENLQRQYSFGADLKIYDTDPDIIKQLKQTKIQTRDRLVARHIANEIEQKRLNGIYTEEARIGRATETIDDECYFWYKTFFTG